MCAKSLVGLKVCGDPEGASTPRLLGNVLCCWLPQASVSSGTRVLTVGALSLPASSSDPLAEPNTRSSLRS